jgi:sigma-E factor negative regulatory protein RseA
MDANKKIREHISALSDGALHPDDLELALAALQAADGRQAWEVYHRIGDVLRAEASPDLSPEFAARLAARLAAEPTHARRAASPAPEAEVKPAVAASASAS